MRALLASCALFATLAGPLSADTARFIKVDIVSKSDLGHHHKGDNSPTEIHVRMPIALAHGVLDMAGGGDIKINGKASKDIKVEQLIKLLESSKPGDMLLEVTTDKGDIVKIAVE